jgi:excisionase family DNA binding protein
MNQNKKARKIIMERQTMYVKDVAKYLGVSKDTIYMLIRTKSMPHIKVGKRILMRKHSIDNWMAEQEEQTQK